MSTIYPATAPLVFHKDLGRSARFHATNLETGMAPLMHPSPCTLKTDVGTSGCDGNPSCACTTGATCNSCGTCADGTDPFVRIEYFYTPGGSGEVAAAGYQDPWGVMDGWVDEAAGADGHRMIVDGASYGLVGFGHARRHDGRVLADLRRRRLRQRQADAGQDRERRAEAVRAATPGPFASTRRGTIRRAARPRI